MRKQAGFTLVELVIVMVLTGIIAGVLATQLGPTIQSYLAVERRAALTDQADTSLRRIATEIRSAVPNSLRLHSSECLELVPTIDGGRLRTGPDIAKPASPGAFLDQFESKAAFDVLTRFTNPVGKGDLVVIGNQNTTDLYDGTNVAVIDTVSQTGDSTGEHRITLTAARTIPQGYDSGRFVVVPAGWRSVRYACVNPGKDAQDNGSGTLYRVTSNALALGAGCPAPANTAPIVATNVEACSFEYSPNQGATQESGFAQLRLTLRARGESVSLTLGAHVDNVP
ncbi:PulJ/GspJ family protein [Massilia sp. BKSP1R2A-1]|uniref:PulJ/GspJ family protein n=1 Tax=Massilia sp. BKSP1R2A-1 TaxID=3422595 RepID=UPI003D335FAB